MFQEFFLIIKISINSFGGNAHRLDQFLNGHLPDAMFQELLKGCLDDLFSQERKILFRKYFPAKEWKISI